MDVRLLQDGLIEFYDPELEMYAQLKLEDLEKKIEELRFFEVVYKEAKKLMGGEK